MTTDTAVIPCEPRPHHRFWPKRLPHAITPPATSLWYNLEVSAQRYPDKAGAGVFRPALTLSPNCTTRPSAWRRWLQGWACKTGDRVMLYMQNCPQLVVAHYAILRANAVVVPVNPMNRAEELKHYIIDPDAKVAISTADLAGELLKASDGAARSASACASGGDALSATPIGAAAADMPAGLGATGCATRHALPALPGGTVRDWATRWPAPRRRPAHDRTARTTWRAALHLGHHRPAQGLHAHRTAADAQRGGRRLCGGTARTENVILAVVPMFHITGMVCGMHRPMYSGATWCSCRAGTASSPGA